jgi:hypothetical protein
MKVALEARMKPDLHRFSMLHQAAADVKGYPDWQTGFNRVRLLDRKVHRGITITSHEIIYIQDSGEEPTAKALTPQAGELFQRLQVATLTRMGHRRWYLVPLEMSFQEAVDLFHLRYYPADDPARALGHQIQDVLYRVDTSDEDGWKWHITFAPVPRSQAIGLIRYDFEAHWSAGEARNAATQVLDRLPEVALFVDLDCYRDSPDMPAADWEGFGARSREKMSATAEKLVASYFEQEI